MATISPRLAILVVLAVLLAACSTPSATPVGDPTTQVEPTAELIAATDTATATEAPSATPSITPVPPTSTPRPTATPVRIAYGPDDFPAGVNPLTGIKVRDADLLERRPLGVKIQLYPRNQRPIYGVSQADVVFDYYQNNGLTRLHALFYGNDVTGESPQQIGPIRSARLFDDTIMRMYQSVFAFGGAARKVLNRLYNSGNADLLVTEGNNNCPPMCRVDPNGFNLLFTDSAKLSQYITDKKVENGQQNLEGISFDTQAPAGGQAVNQIFTRYSISAYNRWDYDPASGRWLRFQDTQEDENGSGEAYAPMIDGLNGAQIAADNVIVLPLTHTYPDPGQTTIIDIMLSGSGPAYVFRDGQVYEVLWNRPASDSVLFFTTTDGEPFPLKPGNTWFQVIGQTSQVEQPEEGTWRFTFQFP